MQLNGAEIVIECLKEQGVDTVFGYPGGAILNVYDELYKHRDEIRHILTSHEQGAAHAADGYATPVDTANKVVTVSSAEELALFAKEVTDDGKNYSGYTLNLANDVDLGEYLWKPINGYKRLSGIVVNGNGHTIRNMKVRGCTNSSLYGAGFIGDILSLIHI